MPDLLCQVALPHVDGLIQDTVNNTFVFHSGLVGDPADMAADAAVWLATDFFNFTGSVGQKPAGFISNRIKRTANACVIKSYDISEHLDGSNHGSPVAVSTFTLADPGVDTALPEEIACVITLRGEGWAGQPIDVPGGPPGPAGDTHPRARYTGHVYMGPLIPNSFLSITSSGSPTTFTTDLRTTLLDAANKLHDTALASSWEAEWSVWSRADGGLKAITHAEVDNVADVQRRRGIRATVREQRVL